MTSQTPGMVWFYFQNAILIAIPASYILLRWYRWQVAQAMRSGSESATEKDDVTAPPDAGPGVSATAVVAASNAEAGATAERQARRRLGLAYTAAGMASAAVMAAFFLSDLDSEITALRAFTVWYAFCWLLVPTLATLLVVPQRRALILLLAYAAAGFAVAVAWSTFDQIVLGHAQAAPLHNATLLLQFLGLQAWLPYLLILATGNRKLRSVSPLVLSGLLVFSYSALLLHYAVIASMDVGPLRRLVLGLVGASFPHLLFLVLALPVGLACWYALRWLARRFEAKAFSDVQLVVDSWWLIAIFIATLELSSSRGWSAWFALLAFPVYRIVLELCLRTRPAGARASRARLLVLRVFGFRSRSEALFDAIAQRWRFVGSVRIIAGTDLVGRTIDPGDLISFLGARLKRQFVHSMADLSRKLGALDEARDPDGRFRINEFFCFDDTWRPTLRALLKRSDMILMDLRGFSEESRGCRFELEQIEATGLLARTLFVIDDTTDTALLQATLFGNGYAPEASQCAGSSHGLHLVRTGTGSVTQADAILGALRGLAPA